MRKLFALLPAAVLAAGCGDTCTNKSAEARVTGTGPCNVAANVPITINVTPACASCADDAPRCDLTPLGAGQEQLDIKVRECDSNKGCSAASCSFGPVSCTFTPPPATGTVDVVYRTGGTTGTVTLNLGGGTATSCTI